MMVLLIPSLIACSALQPKVITVVDVKERLSLLDRLGQQGADVAAIAKSEKMRRIDTDSGTILLSEEALGIPSLRAKTKLLDALLAALQPDSFVLRAERLPQDVREHLRSALAFLGDNMASLVANESFRLLLLPRTTLRIKSGDKTIEFTPQPQISPEDQSAVTDQSGPTVKAEPTQAAFDALFQTSSPRGVWIGSTSWSTAGRAAAYGQALETWKVECAAGTDELSKARQRLTDLFGATVATPGTKLADWSGDAQGRIRRSIELSYEAHGFPDQESAQRFLQGATIVLVRNSFEFCGITKSGSGKSHHVIEFNARP